jgi:hypothetical protein
MLVSAFDPDDAVAPISYVEGAGWKVGESTTLHPVVGMETGYVSNVFYTQNKRSGLPSYVCLDRWVWAASRVNA